MEELGRGDIEEGKEGEEEEGERDGPPPGAIDEGARESCFRWGRRGVGGERGVTAGEMGRSKSILGKEEEEKEKEREKEKEGVWR